MLAPIVMFAFNRPQQLQHTLTALAQSTLAKQSCLTIFCDGPRTDKEKNATDATRAVARSAAGL